MKFKEKRGNTVVFDGGYAGGELELLALNNGFFLFNGIYLGSECNVCTFDEMVKFSDIQTAVNLLQILIKEGLV